MARFTLDPADPPRLSEAERARLDAMTDAEIRAASLSDPHDPPLTEAELERPAIARAMEQRARL